MSVRKCLEQVFKSNLILVKKKITKSAINCYTKKVPMYKKLILKIGIGVVYNFVYQIVETQCQFFI